MPTGRHNVNYTAPIASVDLAAFDDEGAAYEIWPCENCLPFHAEVAVDDHGTVLVREWHAVDDHGTVLVREWHAVDCPQFQALTANPVHEP